jgi:FkbM family methyltransferase
MSLIRRIFYNKFINKILRSLLWPFRNYLPNSLQFPVNGEVEVISEGQKIFFVANETSPMLRELFWKYKYCNFEFSNILLDLVKTSNTFIDVGANIGYYSILAKKNNPALKVYSFEPSHGPFYFLNKNVQLNHLDNISTFKNAVGNQKCTIDFFEDINPKFKYIKYHVSGTGNTQNTWKSNEINKYSIDCITLDDFIKEKSITSVDLIKIDTEATEDKVLLGSINSIQKFKPIIICEVLPNKIENELLKIIESIKYEIYHHIESTDKLVLVSKFIDSEDRNYIFVPKEKIHLLNKYI